MNLIDEDDNEESKSHAVDEPTDAEIDISVAFRATKAALFTQNVFAGAIFGASVAGLSTEEPSQWTLVLTSSLGVSLWGLFLLLSGYAFWKGNERLEILLTWTRNLSIYGLIISILTGILLTLGAVSSCGPHWLAAFNHVMGFLAVLLNLLVWCLLPRIVRFYAGDSLAGAGKRHLRPVRRWVSVILVFGTFVIPLSGFWLVAWTLLGNANVETSEYPDATTSPYKLPFPKGETSLLTQGNGGKASHSNAFNRFSYDFRRPCGTPIVAAREGTVQRVEDSNDGNIFTGSAVNNYIDIKHEDGTTAGYLHLAKGSAMVKQGDQIPQGAPIALAGNVGISSGPHLHFSVYNTPHSYATIPVSFSDVPASDGGIPRALHYYTSGNEQVNP